MLTPVLDFFKKEKGWALLFFLMVICYGLIWMNAKNHSASHAQVSADSAAPPTSLEQFKSMETAFQEKMKSPDAMKKFGNEHPELALIFNLMAIFVMGALAAGLVLDAKIVTDKKFRESLTRPVPPVMTDWQFSMIFKVVMLYMSGSLVMGALLGVVKRFLLPGVSENLFLLTHTTLMDILVFFFIAWAVQSAKGDWRDVGFRFEDTNFLNEVRNGIAGYAAVLPLFLGCLVALLIITNLISYEPPPHPLVNVFLEEEAKQPWLVFYSIFLAIVIGPIFEELFFRGLCYPVIRKHWGQGWAAVITAAFFAVIHGSWFAFLPIFILGLCLAYLYEKRNSLIPCMTLHIIHNSIFIGFFFLGKSIITYAGS